MIDAINLVRFVFEEGAWHGYTYEDLACDLLQGEQARILSPAFYAFGVSVGDIVATNTTDVGRIATGIVKKSQNVSFRVFFRRSPEHEEKLIALIGEVQEYGTCVDDLQADYILFALSVPKDRYAFVESKLKSADFVDYEVSDKGSPAVGDNGL